MRNSAESQPDERIDDHATDPFAPERLRINQQFGEGQDVRKIVASCPVRKPTRQEFFRTHPDPEYSINVAVLEFKEERQHYLVNPELAPTLPGEAVAKTLYTTLTMHGGLMLWPIRLPDEQGRLDPWNETAHTAAETAKTSWIRLMANMPAGTYDVLEATGTISEPNWPDRPFKDLLELAFKGKFIEAHDHPILKKLRGEF